jgi:hypothetical protein
VTREEIEQGFLSAGWEMAGRSHRTVVGVGDRVSIQAPRWVWGANDHVFELSYGNTSYWVREIPTPYQATKLLEEHGGPREEERGNPYKQDR